MKVLLLLCALGVSPGWHYCVLTSHYSHLYPQDGEITWSSTTGMWIEGPRIVYAGERTHPMGHEWVVDSMLAIRCGEMPDPNLTRIFADGFETGNFIMWDQSAMNETRYVYADQ